MKHVELVLIAIGIHHYQGYDVVDTLFLICVHNRLVILLLVSLLHNIIPILYFLFFILYFIFYVLCFIFCILHFIFYIL